MTVEDRKALLETRRGGFEMKRHRIEIIAQILASCSHATQKTRIKNGINLNHAQLEDYLSLLTSRHLLTYTSGEYLTTEKGYRFLKAFAKLKDVLEDRTFRALVNTNQVDKEDAAEPMYFARM